MPLTRKQIAEEKRRLRAEYGALFDAVAELLFRADPIGINFQSNADEYEPEARTILPRLRECTCEADVIRVVHEEFIRWFGAEIAGPPTNYSKIGADIWRVWRAPNAA